METLAETIERSRRAIIRASLLCGSSIILAKKIGVSKQRLNHWKSGYALLPYEAAVKIFVVTNGQVGLHDLRSDLIHTTKKMVKILKQQDA